MIYITNGSLNCVVQKIRQKIKRKLTHKQKRKNSTQTAVCVVTKGKDWLQITSFSVDTPLQN